MRGIRTSKVGHGQDDEDNAMASEAVASPEGSNGYRMVELRKNIQGEIPPVSGCIISMLS